MWETIAVGGRNEGPLTVGCGGDAIFHICCRYLRPAETNIFKRLAGERPTMSDIVVSASWVADRLDDVRVVDVRDAWEFDGIGHIPGAVNIPFDSFRAEDADEGMLPGEDAFADLLGEAGITREDDVVAYDDHHGVFAARFLVTAELYGHPRERLHLLDGDFSAWQRDRETTGEATAVEPTTYEIRRPDETPLVDADTVAAAIDDPDTVIVDTREDWEFEESHIPGATVLDWRELVDDETRGLKPRTEIESILADNGITPERRVLLYCNTARRISHTYVVLRHLGYEKLAFYEGSLTEWEAAGRPVESD
jgi:thiosulfate/3-mercaptopyruvate sulfurtransferase